MSDSEVTSKGPCPDCSSSDACTLYTDGHTHCFSCGKTRQNGAKNGAATGPSNKPKVRASLISDVEISDLSARRLTETTCHKFNYGTASFKGEGVHVAEYRTPDGSEIVAQKIRTSDKDFLILGDMKRAGLFGQYLWGSGGRKVVVTEGEIDCLSVSQAQENKWPVVSIPTGSNGAKKALAKSLDWLETFDEVILMFDMDEPGRKAASECVELFTPGKCKVAELPLKDPNDCLKAGQAGAIINAMWQAKVIRPDGIVAGVDLWDLVKEKPPEGESIPFPWTGLTGLTRGWRKGELLTFTAGTGIGKSEALVGEIGYDLMTKGEILGVLALEEPVRRTAIKFMGKHLNVPLHLVEDTISEAIKREAFDATVGSGRLFLFDHFGSTDGEHLMGKIRYLAKGCGCTTILLDHISIVVSGTEGDDERRIIDNLMTNLATLAQQLNVRIGIISHLKKADGTPHEEGGRITMDALRGSASIKQLSHTIVALERDQQDEQKKLWTLVRVLKCRFTGETGEACWLKYDKDSGRLHEAEPAFESFEEDEKPPFKTTF